MRQQWTCGGMMLLVALALGATVGCAQRTPGIVEGTPRQTTPTEDLLAEARQTNQRLETLNTHMAALTERIDIALRQDRDSNNSGADLVALKKIELPDEPTAEQVEAYVTEIALVTRQQRRWGNEDPQVTMLAQAGRVHLRPLLTSLGMFDTMDRYLVEAIKLSARDDQKEMVIDHLVRRPELMDVVTSRGWIEAAKPVLIEEVRTGRARTNSRWLSSLAQLRDPEVKELLVRAFIDGPNRQTLLGYIDRLPGVDLPEVVAAAWDKARMDAQNERLQTAGIAVAYGHEDALKLLVDSLPPTPPPGQRTYYHGGVDARSTVLIHIDFYGDNEAIRDWYTRHQGTLRFDTTKRRFIPTGTAAQDPGDDAS